MLLLSAIAMYITMYFNTYKLNHVFFSWTRMYMTLIGVGAMAIIMLVFMLNMYQSKKKNIAVLLTSVSLMVSATTLVRMQLPIDDIKWMKAMIPHHSIAILTSSRADIKNKEVKQLAEEIIEAQKREIEKMKQLIQKLENK